MTRNALWRLMFGVALVVTALFMSAHLATAGGGLTPEEIVEATELEVSSLHDQAWARATGVFDDTRAAILAEPSTVTGLSKQFKLSAAGVAKVEKDVRKTAVQIRRVVSKAVSNLTREGADPSTIQIVSELSELADELELALADTVGINLVEEISLYRGWGLVEP